MAAARPATFAELMHKRRGVRAAWEYPFAAVRPWAGSLGWQGRLASGACTRVHPTTVRQLAVPWVLPRSAWRMHCARTHAWRPLERYLHAGRRERGQPAGSTSNTLTHTWPSARSAGRAA